MTKLAAVLLALVLLVAAVAGLWSGEARVGPPAAGWAVRDAQASDVADGIWRVYRFARIEDHLGGRAGLGLIAGRMSRERAFTYRQGALVNQIVRRKQKELNPELVCIFSGDFPEIDAAPDAAMAGRLFVGLSIADVDASPAAHQGPIPVELLRIRLD